MSQLWQRGRLHMSADETRREETETTDHGHADGARPEAPRGEREADFTRRALLQAGWTTPVILAATLPRTAHAQSAHTDAHTDSHGDSHQDGHGDDSVDNPHIDTPHVDTPHSDHIDATHSDAHTDTHSDISHSDTPLDSPFADTHTDTHTDLP
jgi:hypothetical protein